MAVLRQRHGCGVQCMVYSLAETVNANGVEPYEYLLLVLSYLPYYGKTPSYEIMERLMHWNLSAKRRKYLMTSDC